MLTKTRLDRGSGRQLCSMITIVWLLTATSLTQIDAFNLENRLPIVKRGEDGTYFGYSVASHVITDEEYDTNQQKW